MVCHGEYLSVGYHGISSYLIFPSKTKLHRFLYPVGNGVFKVFITWLSIKTLHSRVLATFVGHRHLPSLLPVKVSNHRKPCLMPVSTEKNPVTMLTI
jgi:hypothetical protein